MQCVLETLAAQMLVRDCGWAIDRIALGNQQLIITARALVGWWLWPAAAPASPQWPHATDST